MLFSTSLIYMLKAVVVTKQIAFGVFFLTSLISLSKTVVVTKPLVPVFFFYQHLHFFL